MNTTPEPVWPDRVLQKVDVVVRDLTSTGSRRDIREATKVAILNVLSNEVGSLVDALKQVEREGCCCSMDYASACSCDAVDTAREAVRSWTGKICWKCDGEHLTWECPVHP